jgi:hypothetical protein
LLSPKTDNKSLADKVALRRLLIEESGLEPLRVLDLYAGEGKLWQELRREPRLVDEDHPRAMQVEKYTPVDQVAKQPGQIRFKVSPRLIAALNGDDAEDVYSGTGLSRFNVIDVDSYGDCWGIWTAILFRIKTPTVIFVTRGSVAFGAGRANLSAAARISAGIPVDWSIPVRLELIEFTDGCALLQECPTAKITLGYQIKLPRRGSSMIYFGVLVEPK